MHRMAAVQGPKEGCPLLKRHISESHSRSSSESTIVWLLHAAEETVRNNRQSQDTDSAWYADRESSWSPERYADFALGKPARATADYPPLTHHLQCRRCRVNSPAHIYLNANALSQEKLNESIMALNKSLQVCARPHPELVQAYLLMPAPGSQRAEYECRARSPDVQELSVQCAVSFGRYVHVLIA